MQLLESGRNNFPTRKLGLDMLRQLSLHHDYVSLLVQDGYYLEALRYTRKFKVIFFDMSHKYPRQYEMSMIGFSFHFFNEFFFLGLKEDI